ncbi:phosphosulfolactate synthase [Bacillus marasmi]|uniref:phosphosulfolactate synthase n=1 Tax=Bacillus marasmi TaxID=1926279 RepID=UPI0011CB62E1|nr:phosphosulfolactate synthase [Bacillus marasmi]
MEFLNLPKRTTGRRSYGLTSIVDFGTPIGELKNILNDYSSYIDIAKIGIGTAYVTPNIKAKIELYKQFNVIPYCGGTLFEKSYLQQKIPQYIRYLKILGIDWVEVSNGTIDIPLEERLSLISILKKDFHVMSEVGSKDCNKDFPVSKWKEEIQILLDAGCEYVITEGRDSGTAGIYGKNGEVKSDLIQELVKDIDYKRLIFEAPTAKHQMYFIQQLGANVNLGNVKIQDAVILEAQRQGLRSETFYLEDSECTLR